MTSDGLRPVPGALEVARALRGASHPAALVHARLAEATALAQVLTAARGFSDDGRRVHADLAQAITASVVRSLANPSLPLTLVEAPIYPHPGGFDYWTEADLVLMAGLRGRGTRPRLASSDPSGGRDVVRSVASNCQPHPDGSEEP